MLPYFHITKDNNKMFVQDIPQKPKRKSKPEVPVHKPERLDKRTTNEKTYKTYSANFNGKKNKQQPEEEAPKKHGNKESSKENQNQIQDQDPDEARLNAKLSRKYLSKENEKLVVENQELADKLQALEEYLNKKNCKLKEKVGSLEALNAQISGENVALRLQCEQMEAQLLSTQSEVQRLQNCENCKQLAYNLEQSKNEIAVQKKAYHEMNEDVNMLKNVVYRLNVQLERYQEKLSKHNIRISALKNNQVRRVETAENLQTINSEDLLIKSALPESHWDHQHTPISWGKVNVHTLGPLLDAYQETITEKEEIIQDYEAELAKFTTRLKDVIKENELLHKRLNEDSGCSKQLNKQIDVLSSDLKMTKEQNDLLIKKCALKQDKVEEVLKCFESKVEQMKRDYAVLHEQYCKSRSEISALKEKNKNLVEAHDDFKNERQTYIPITVHKSSVDECKKWYEELKTQYEVEKAKLTESLEAFKQQIKELNERVNCLNKEKAEMESKMKNSEKLLKKAEVKYLDLQHNLNEVQLSRSACRKQLHKAMNFAKDLVAEQESLLKALNQRHLENKAVKRLGSDIACRMDSLKNQLKLVQKDAWEELTTVEQRLQEQNAVIVKMKQEHNLEIERLKRIIQDKDNVQLLKENGSSIPIPHYLLYRDKHSHNNP